MCDESLCAEVVFERNCFDIFLDTATDGAISPGIDSSEVRKDVRKESLNLVEACLVFFSDLWGNR